MAGKDALWSLDRKKNLRLQGCQLRMLIDDVQPAFLGQTDVNPILGPG